MEICLFVELSCFRTFVLHSFQIFASPNSWIFISHLSNLSYLQFYHDSVVSTEETYNEFPIIVFPAFTDKFGFKPENVLVVGEYFFDVLFGGFGHKTEHASQTVFLESVSVVGGNLMRVFGSFGLLELQRLLFVIQVVSEPLFGQGVTVVDQTAARVESQITPANKVTWSVELFFFQSHSRVMSVDWLFGQLSLIIHYFSSSQQQRIRIFPVVLNYFFFYFDCVIS